MDTGSTAEKLICAATSETVPSYMCIQQKLKSACTSAQSDQNLRCSNEKTLHLGYPNAHSKDSDQTV